MFSYKGVDKDYNYKVGSVEAKDAVDAVRKIKEEEDILIVVSLSKASRVKAVNSFTSAIGSRYVKLENRIRNSRRARKLRKQGKPGTGKLGADEPASLSERSPVLRMLKAVSNKATGSRLEVDQDVYDELQSIFKEDMVRRRDDYDEFTENKVAHYNKQREEKKGKTINWELLDTHDEKDPEVRRNNRLKVKSKELLMFTRRLHIMLSSGVPLLSSLSLMQETGSKNMTLVLDGVLEDIKVGNTFSEAIAKYPNTFNASYVSLVSIGETSGELSECLADIIKMKEQEQKVLKKVKTASIYPAIVGVVLATMMIAATLFFLPKFEEMYEDQELVTPPFTNLVFGIAGMVPYIVGISIVLIIAIIFLRKKVVRVNQVYVGIRDRLLLDIPVVKDISQALYMYYFSSTVSLMLKNGIRLSDTLELAGRSINNIYIRSEIENVEQLMTHGLSFSEALREQPHFDDVLVNITLTGEESGQMVFSLTRVSEYYDTELNNKVDAMMEIVPPMSIVIISIIAAPVIIAAYLPILEISSGGIGNIN